jgi:poly-gamma-glutamate system protein
MKHLLQMIRSRSGFGGRSQLDSAQNRLILVNRVRLLLMATGLAGLWYLAGAAGLTPEEDRLWERVRAAQLHLSQWRHQNGTASTRDIDPWNCGLIGLEWSAITTTLGELASKRTACNPAWAVQFSRWFRDLDLKPGDHIVIYSSASFPGLLLNAIAAAEAMQLEPLVIVSLGASTWGANHPDIPWPIMATELRRNGFIRKPADFYTLGGGAELGHGLAPEGAALLLEAVNETGIEVLTALNLQEIILRKTELMERFEPRLFVNIGGSQANLGDDGEVLRLQPGLVRNAEPGQGGNGIIGVAIGNRVPVIHMLNLKSVSAMVGIPYDGSPGKFAPSGSKLWWYSFGLSLFFIILLTHRRWRLEPDEERGPTIDNHG